MRLYLSPDWAHVTGMSVPSVWYNQFYPTVRFLPSQHRPLTYKFLKQTESWPWTQMCFAWPIQCFKYFFKLAFLDWGRHSPGRTPVGSQPLTWHIYLLCDMATRSRLSVAPQFDSYSYSIPFSQWSVFLWLWLLLSSIKMILSPFLRWSDLAD